jgi:pantoate--beta-alanine ligase
MPATSLQLVHNATDLRSAVAAARRAGQRIGLVPTMGALHAGHASLVDISCQQSDFTVATIFVNPTQFGPHEDLQKYPRTLDADLQLLSQHGAHLAYVPQAQDIYPPGYATSIDVGPVSHPWEGAVRPGHFPGVATVVMKLFNLVQADIAFFGHKDYQQSVVIRQMVADLNVPIQIVVCPTIRESDGLALSSRNAYLTPDDRRRALVLSRSLRHAAERVASGERNSAAITAAVQNILATEPEVRLDYFAIVDPHTLASVDRIDSPAIALIAARVGTTRLIDNWRLEPIPTPSPSGSGSG